nr:von Willebrand factor and C-type lectin domain containing protein [Haemonchus contortus]
MRLQRLLGLIAVCFITSASSDSSKSECDVLPPYFRCNGAAVVIIDGTPHIGSFHDFQKEMTFVRDRLTPRIDFEHDFKVAYLLTGFPYQGHSEDRFVSCHKEACEELDAIEKLAEKEGFRKESLKKVLQRVAAKYEHEESLILFSKSEDEIEISDAGDYARKYLRIAITVVALSGDAHPWRHFPAESVFPVCIDKLNQSPHLAYCLAERSCAIFRDCDPGWDNNQSTKFFTQAETSMPVTTKKATPRAATTQRPSTTGARSSTRAPTEAPVTYSPSGPALPTSIPNVEGTPCACNYSTSWNDVMLVFESTESTTEHGLQEMLAYVQSNLFRFNILPYPSSNQLSTRIGVVVYGLTAHLYAPLGSLTYNEFLNIQSLPYYGDSIVNLEDALRMAALQFQTEMDRSNSRNVIILLATSYSAGGAFNPKQVADQFKEDNGVLVVYNYAEEHGFPEPKLQDIASPGYFLSSQTDLVGNGISEALCSANCFCRQGYDPFQVNAPRNIPSGGCYSTKQAQTTYSLAASRCRTEGGVVALAKTRNQTEYLDIKFVTDSSFWIGLKWDQLSQTYKWADGSTLLPESQQWISSAPHQTGVDCVRVAPQGAELVWIAADCRQSFVYSCEIAACDSETLCTEDV